MTQALALPAIRITDANGSPISGAKAYFYATGTTTLQSVYTNASLATAHENPVTANANGILAPIFLDHSKTYRLVVKDASGAAIDGWDIDPINGASLANIQFAQAGTGAASRTALAKLRETVSVTDYGAAGDGSTDDTAAFQAAHDALPNGGRILVPKSANPYRVSRVNITNRNITVDLESGAVLKKYGSAGGADTTAASMRGMFWVQEMIGAYFTIRGGEVDLNGEGPIGIGVEGRIANLYNTITVGTIKGIAGPNNALIFALRSTHITVESVKISNSGESGLLFRNCSDTLVEDCDFSNIANYGVEWSYVSAINDQADPASEMPDRSRNYVRNCTFEDMNDWALGTGNGCGAGGGGTTEENPRDHEVVGCTMRRCQRDVNLEFAAGTDYFEGGKIDIRSFDAGQGSVGLIGVVGFDVNVIARNPGAAPTAALSAGASPTASDDYTDVYGVLLSSPVSDDNRLQVNITDDRGIKVYRGTDGAITAGDSTFTSATATFTADHVGLWLGILGAGPDGICHQARITAYNSATSIEIERPAVTTVSGATYAYGGALRYGVKINRGGDASVAGVIKAGIASGLPNEPDAAGIYVDELVEGRIDTSGALLAAPTTTGTTPTGLLLSGTMAGSGKLRPGGMRVRGYTNNFVGVRLYGASVETKTYRKRGVAVVSSGVADVYGAFTDFTPPTNHFDMVTGVSFAAGGAFAGGETVTVDIVFYYYDTGDETLSVPITATGTTTLTFEQLADLIRENASIRDVKMRWKSSIVSSAVTITGTVMGVGA